MFAKRNYAVFGDVSRNSVYSNGRRNGSEYKNSPSGNIICKGVYPSRVWAPATCTVLYILQSLFHARAVDPVVRLPSGPNTRKSSAERVNRRVVVDRGPRAPVDREQR